MPVPFTGIETTGSHEVSLSGEPLYAFDLAALPLLDRASPVPIYRQLSERLAAVIRGNRQAIIGLAIPTELACAAHFGISRLTVRQAMAELVHSGLIARHRGRGSFVEPEPRDGFELEIDDEEPGAVGPARFVLTGTCRQAGPNGPGVMLVLGLLHVGRICWHRNRVSAYEELAIPANLFAELGATHLETTPMQALAAMIAGTTPVRVLSVLDCAEADEPIAHYLGVNAGTAVLRLDDTYLDGAGRTILRGQTWRHGQHARLHRLSVLNGRAGSSVAADRAGRLVDRC